MVRLIQDPILYIIAIVFVAGAWSFFWVKRSSPEKLESIYFRSYGGLPLIVWVVILGALVLLRVAGNLCMGPWQPGACLFC